MHDVLFENQLHLKTGNLRRYAEERSWLERYDTMGDHVYLQRVTSTSTAAPGTE